jgi:hypothetical protein
MIFRLFAFSRRMPTFLGIARRHWHMAADVWGYAVFLVAPTFICRARLLSFRRVLAALPGAMKNRHAPVQATTHFQSRRAILASTFQKRLPIVIARPQTAAVQTALFGSFGVLNGASVGHYGMGQGASVVLSRSISA